MIKIIVDSTCNLTPETLKEYDIRVAPISIQFENETYEEEIDIDRDTFYRKIEEMGIIPTTSQPTPAWYAKYYKELAAQGHSILVITITSKHSGTYASAMMAKEMVPEADVEVFDSLSISLGTGWMVLEAARAIEAGQDREAVIARLTEIRDRSHLFLTPATLKYLKMSGRVGGLRGVLGSMLNILPVIILKDGLLEVGESIRTRGKSINRLVGLMEEAVGTQDAVNMAVIHAHAPEDGKALLERVKSTFNCHEVIMADLVASLAVHGGPGIIAMFGYKA
ncbi:MAG: DegV family protein [Anaerolineales bacterium]|jgi:DegV family protein with EDD domain